jgi:hypothetical protein
MGFDSGSVSFRLFYLKPSFGPDLVARLAAHAAPPIETLGREPIQGWVTGRHLLDTRLTEESCVFGGYLHASLMRAERKIPEALLRAHRRLEEEAHHIARGVGGLPQAVRREIRDAIFTRLLPTMPPTLTGLPMVLALRDNRLFAGALSDAQMDRFGPAFREAAGVLPIALNAETAALQRRQVNARDLETLSFSPDPEVPPETAPDLGLDFLNWLWWWWETEGGMFHLERDGQPLGMMLEGPLTFVREGKGAYEAVLRKGTPLNSREAGVALLGGKRLRRAKFLLAQGEQSWSATVDADFGFRGLKLPKGEALDPSGAFQERMRLIETFTDAFMNLYDRFLEQRGRAAQWRQTVDAMRAWVGQRAGA